MSKSGKPAEPERRDQLPRKEKAGEIKIPERKKKQEDAPLYKTEDQLKAEVMERQRIERLMAAKRKPKSKVEKKAENFWYHYRGAFIAGIVGIVMVVFFVKDVVFKVKPDISIVMVTQQYLPSEYVEELTSAIEAFAPDLNGDGRVDVSIDHIPHTPFSASGEAEAEVTGFDMQGQDYNYIMKLMTVIAATDDPIYILDQANFAYINAMGEDSDEPYSVFESLDALPGASGYALPMENTDIGAGEIAAYFDELSFYFRSVRVTNKNQSYMDNCMRFLEDIASKS